MPRRKRHTQKHIESALKYAEAEGWTVEDSTGGASHPWATLKCPYNSNTCRNGVWCRLSVWGTPADPERFAKQIISAVDKCEVHRREKQKRAGQEEQ
jgi:hypothetical protein